MIDMFAVEPHLSDGMTGRKTGPFSTREQAEEAGLCMLGLQNGCAVICGFRIIVEKKE